MNPSLQQLKVLLVDDEPLILEILSDVLSEMSLDITVCGNGVKALCALQQDTYDIVLCDIMMPEMNGLDCMKTARSKGIQTPFVFLSGYGDNRKVREALQLGAKDFINKPFETEAVKDTVKKTLEIG